MLKKIRVGHQRGVGQKGFTLIEIVLTIAILSIGILGVMTMQIRAARSNTTAGKITSSASWVTDQFERLMAMEYDDPALAPGITATPNDSMVNNPALPTDIGPYTVTYTVSNAGVPIPNVKVIDITVTHDTEPDRTLSFRYYKADTF